MQVLLSLAICVILAFVQALPLNAAAFTHSAAMSAQELSDALNKMFIYAQALNDYRSSKFRATVEDRYGAWDKRHENTRDPNHKPVFRTALNGFGSRYDRAVSSNPNYALKMEPGDSLLAALDENYQKLHKTLQDLDRYYSRGDWKEDNQAKAGEYMRELRVGLPPLVKAYDGLRKFYEDVEGPLTELCLARCEAEYKQNYYWHISMLMLQAKKMLPMAPLDPDAFDATAFKAELDKFIALADAHEDYLSSADEAFRNEANSRLRTRNTDSFISTCRTMLTARQENSPNRYKNHISVLYAGYNNMASDVYGITFKEPKEMPRKPLLMLDAPKPE